MGLSSSASNLVYNQSIDVVYNAILNGAQVVKYKVASADPINHIICLSVPISLFTWGEKLTVNLYTINDGRTSVIFNSESNLGIEIAASSINKKNIDKLIKAMSNFLNVQV